MSAPCVMLQAGTVVRRLVDFADEVHEPADDMADLAEVIRTLLAVEACRETRVRLGGHLFDVVITSSGFQARSAVTLVDEIQDGCGPVIEDPENGWLYWLVPPGSSTRWEAHSHAVCRGAPRTITLPPLSRRVPPGPYWVRTSASDRLVPVPSLREALAQLRPEPTPHAELAARLGAAAT